MKSRKTNPHLFMFMVLVCSAASKKISTMAWFEVVMCCIDCYVNVVLCCWSIDSRYKRLGRYTKYKKNKNKAVILGFSLTFLFSSSFHFFANIYPAWRACIWHWWRPKLLYAFKAQIQRKAAAKKPLPVIIWSVGVFSADIQQSSAWQAVPTGWNWIITPAQLYKHERRKYPAASSAGLQPSITHGTSALIHE